MAPFDGLLLKPVLAACFCGRCRTCMGRTAADHRRTLPRRRTSTYRASTSRAARSGAGRTALQLFSWRTAAPRNSTDACRPVPAHDETRSPRSRSRLRGYELPQSCLPALCLVSYWPLAWKPVSRRSLFSGPLAVPFFPRFQVCNSPGSFSRGAQGAAASARKTRRECADWLTLAEPIYKSLACSVFV